MAAEFEPVEVEVAPEPKPADDVEPLSNEVEVTAKAVAELTKS